MSVIEKINKKLNSYLMDNDVPDTLYLGYQEFTHLELKMKEFENLGLTRKVKTSSRPKFQNMTVFLVHAETHIAFASI